VDANRKWASRAPLLIIVFARREFLERGKPNHWAQFDSGAAWFSLCLQAQKMGLACHAMGGFKSDQAYEVANVDPEKYHAMCVIAVGQQGPPENLDDELRQKEESRSDRKPLSEVVHEGPLPG
jgi:nitroreductase